MEDTDKETQVEEKVITPQVNQDGGRKTDKMRVRSGATITLIGEDGNIKSVTEVNR
ncbi:MAG: hypothetical protein KJ621_21160 [Proteobacteria bacterium]|nr:hypothetical protein [Pseudomonadota bacterium]